MTAKAEKIVTDIQKLLNDGIVERGQILAKIGESNKITNRSFDRWLMIARERNAEVLKRAEEAMGNTYVSTIEQAVKNGLKSKLQRVMEKQADVDRLRKMASDGMVEDVFFDRQGLPQDFTRKMTPTEVAQVLKHASAIEAEISKIMDDYPIQKHQIQAQVIHVSVSNENDTEDADYTIPEVE